MTPLRVLHVASGDLWAGAEVMLLRLATAQSRLADAHVTVILLNEGRLADELRREGVATHVLPESQHGVGSLILKCRRIIADLAPDIVHSHRIKEDLIAGLASLVAHRTVCVRTVHGVDETARVGLSLRQRIARLSHAACVRILFTETFAVAQSLVEALRRASGGGRVRYISNGVNVTELQPLAKSRLSEPDAQLRVGIAGRLVPIKRVDLFLNMAALLQRRQPGRFHFEVYGDGPQREALESLATQLDLTDCVTFHGFNAAMTEALRTLDVLYLTSDSEGLPMVLLEAMALGVPVVAHAVGEIPVVLEDGACGTLVRRHDAEGYASVAEALAAEPERFMAMARAAKERVARAYSAENSAREYIAEYRRILLEKKRA